MASLRIAAPLAPVIPRAGGVPQIRLVVRLRLVCVICHIAYTG
jgi:hypothetical protein